MKIISERRREHIPHFVHSYRLAAPEGTRFHGSGCGVDCDKDGNVDLDKLKAETPIGYNNYMEHRAAALGETEGVWRLDGVMYDIGTNEAGERDYVPVLCTGEWKLFKVYDAGVTDYSKDYTHPAVGECNRCGEEVVLYGFTNSCECGADYNMSGQELAPRSQWGEETGESLQEILSVDADHDNYYGGE